MKEHLLDWIDKEFDNMILRPGMYAGEMNERGMDCFELQVGLLLAFRNQILGPDAKNEWREYRDIIRKFKVGACGLGSVCKDEADFVEKMTYAWNELKLRRDKRF